MLKKKKKDKSVYTKAEMNIHLEKNTHTIGGANQQTKDATFSWSAIQ